MDRLRNRCLRAFSVSVSASPQGFGGQSSSVPRRISFIASHRDISAEAPAGELLDEATRSAEGLGDIVVAFACGLQVAFPKTGCSRESVEAADSS